MLRILAVILPLMLITTTTLAGPGGNPTGGFGSTATDDGSSASAGFSSSNPTGGFGNLPDDEYETMGPPLPPPPPTTIPLDGGAILLISAGLGLGARTLLSRKKKEQ